MMPCLPIAFCFLKLFSCFAYVSLFGPSLPVSSVSWFRACCIYQRLIQSSFDGEQESHEERKEGMVKGKKKKKKRKCTSPSLHPLLSFLSTWSIDPDLMSDWTSCPDSLIKFSFISHYWRIFHLLPCILRASSSLETKREEDSDGRDQMRDRQTQSSRADMRQKCIRSFDQTWDPATEWRMGRIGLSLFPPSLYLFHPLKDSVNVPPVVCKFARVIIKVGHLSLRYLFVCGCGFIARENVPLLYHSFLLTYAHFSPFFPLLSLHPLYIFLPLLDPLGDHPLLLSPPFRWNSPLCPSSSPHLIILSLFLFRLPFSLFQCVYLPLQSPLFM